MTEQQRPLNEIAREILEDWKNISLHAKPHVEDMLRLRSIDDRFGADTAYDVVTYFLANADTWRGEIARRIKKELRGMMTQHQAKI